jgi:hypothetical protein
MLLKCSYDNYLRFYNSLIIVFYFFKFSVRFLRKCFPFLILSTYYYY